MMANAGARLMRKSDITAGTADAGVGVWSVAELARCFYQKEKKKKRRKSMSLLGSLLMFSLATVMELPIAFSVCIPVFRIR